MKIRKFIKKFFKRMDYIREKTKNTGEKENE